jgi:excisionase family DNA binding protein
MDKLLLTPVEAASALSISRSKFYELLTAGRVQSVRIDGCRRIPVAALLAYVDDLNSVTEPAGTCHAA